MARWSGKGIPPTRKKLHRFRASQEVQRVELTKADRKLEDWLRRSGDRIDRAMASDDGWRAR